MKPIEFTLIYAGEEHRIKTFPGEYEDLRLLIIERISPRNFGLCDGMGRCATCIISFTGENIQSPVYLSCQLPINDELANTRIRIPANSIS